jgi:hypothetical protein
MFNYTQGFPLVEDRPSAGLLSLKAYTPAQVLSAYDGDNLEFLDSSKISDPLYWTRGETKKTETYNEWFAIQQALGTLEGNLTGISDQYLGIANEPLKGAALRQLVGKAPLTPWRWSDSELTEEALAQDQKELNTLLEAEQGIDIAAIPVDQLTENQNLIRKLASKFAYVEAEKKAKDKLGFNWLDLLDAQEIFGISLSDRELAGDTKDIEERLSRFDPNFDSKSWFASKFSDEIVTRGLIENGITADLIADAPNEDAAFMRIMSRLSITDLQRRAASYTPTTLDKGRLFRDTIITGVINSPDTIPSVVVELGLAGLATTLGSPAAGAATLGATSAVTSALGGTSVFMRLKRAYDAIGAASKTMKVAGYAAETLYKMPIGIMPSYVKNFGLIRGTAASFTFGAVQGGMAEYARQQREIAFGASTLYATPNAMTDYNLSLVARSALESGAAFGAVFGLGGGLLRSGVGALKNRMSGVLIDPVTGVRNIADQRFTFESTPLGNTIDNIRNFVGKEERALIDAPVPDQLAAESILNRTEVTTDTLVSRTEARVDRVETREAARSPDAARATPEDAGTRRYEGETIPEYIARVAPNRAIRNIYEIMSEVARRTPTEGSLRLIESSEQFDNMSIQDQMRVLFNSKKVLEDAKKAETDSVGLPKERERLYDELEKSRKSWFARLKKKLPKAAFKALKEELEENKKASGKRLPDLLKEARNTGKTAAERKAASDELAARLLETASAMAAAPDREAAIRATVPPEVLDSLEAAVVEQHLTGTISDETADSIIKNIAGEEVETKLSPLNRVARAAKNAITVAKISPDRVKKIKAIIKDPDSFVSVIDGDKDNALRFFDFVNELVLNDMISEIDRNLLLASTVHLNFSSKAFNIQFAVESVLENGKIQPDIVGIFRRRNNSIVMNSDFTGTTASIKRRRAKTLLHELGHAYFAHEASGANYLDALRLYNKTILTSGVELMRVRPETTDPLLDSAFLGQYHMQNAEEMFVQTFSQILFTEAEAAINTFSPPQVSRARNVLDKLATNITLAAAMFNKSDYYNAAKDIIDSITEVDSKLKDRVSMPTLARTYSKLYPMFDTVTDAAEYNKKIDAEFPNQDMKPYHLNQAEVDLFAKTKGDPSFIIAMTIMKADRRSFIDANGNFTKSIVDLVKAYNDYKTTQLTSMQIKIAFLVGSLDYKKIEALDKFDRLDFIKDELFSVYSRTIFKGKSKRTLVPATYEDLDALKNLDTMDYLDPTGNSVPYAVGFFGTSGETLINAIASTQPKGKALVADALSADDVAKLVEAMRTDAALTTNLIDRLRIYLDNIGLPELANVVTEVNHLAYIERLKTEGMLDVRGTNTESPEFKTWFGSSKVVDGSGQPLILYHGTSKDTDFTKFRIGKRGAWFTTDAASASQYAMENDSQKIVFEWDATKGRQVGREVNTASRIIPVYLKIERPAKLTPEELQGFQLAENYAKYQADLFEKYKRAGYDGVDMGDGVWVVFEPTQIKSIYNRGTFDPAVADIRRNVVEPEPSTPIWPNKEVANTSLALMLKEKLSVEQIKVILKANLSSSTYSYITNKYSTPKKLLGAVSKLIDEDGLVFNQDSQRWGIKLTSTKPKVTVEAQAQAISLETTVLTKDNLMKVIARIGEKYSRGTDTDEYFTEALASMMMPKEQAKELGGVAGNLELILSKIENGSLATVKDFVNYIHATANNLRKNQQKKAPEVKATAADRIVTTKKDIRFTILSEALAFNTATQGRLLTPQEIELIRVFNESSSMAEAGAKLKRSARTAGNYRAKLIAKITDVFEQASIRLDSDRTAIAAALNKYFDTVASVVDKAKPDTEKKVTSKVTEAKSKPEKSPVEAGARMAQTAALAEKLRNKNPDPVPVPVPANTEAVLYKVTDEVTGNEPEKVLRPSEQADAIIHGSQTAAKEAVAFTPKKPLSMDFGTSEALASQPEKLAGVLKSASRLGFDALVFKDGSVIPINIEELPVVGKTVIKKEPDAPAEVEITTVDKTPVLNVISKPRQPAQPKARKESFPVKVVKKKVLQTKPKSKGGSKTKLSDLKKELLTSFKTRKERIDHLVKLGYAKVFNTDSGNTPFVLLEDRLTVVINVKGKDIPFYISTGLGGKKDVAAGQWYPFFGMTEDNSWFIKLTGKEINDVYGSPELKAVKELLDESFGNLDDEMQQLPMGNTLEEMRSIPSEFYKETGLSGVLAQNKKAVDSLSTLLKTLNTSGIKKGDPYNKVKAFIDSVVKEISEGKELEAPSVTPSTPRIPTPPKREVPVEPIESDLVKTPETDVVERKTNDDPALLRQSGMDSNFLKTFIKKYWESKIEADSGTTMTPMFKNMWAHFVNVNQYIADANKRVLGDDIMDKFWKAVDRLRTESLLRKVTEGPAGKKPLTYRQMLEKAAEEIKVDGKPDFVIPLLPEEIKFVKVNAEGDYRLSARSKKAKDIIDAAGEDPKLPGPPRADVIIREGEGQPELPIRVEEEPPTPKEKIIDSKINQSEAGASRLLRFNNMVGGIFGGNQRDSKSWWEDLMNKSTNATQGASALGNTIRSAVDRLSFVARFFDDTKTQTAHLVGAGKTAFKTAMQLRSEEGRLMNRILREYALLNTIAPRLSNDIKAKLDMYIYESLYKGRQPNKADLVALGIPVHLAEKVATQASKVIKSSQIANRNILELETQTGRMSIVDENGNPVSHLTYAPVQLDHEGLARLDQNSRAALINAMVTARTNRKLNDPMLDMNTMIAMGWLDVAFDDDAKTLSVFAPDRTIKYSESANMFSNDTLLKLFDSEIKKEGITGRKSEILRLLRKSNPEKFFVLEFDDKYVIYRVPEKVTDLAPADKAKYVEAIKGNTAMYTDKWRTILNNKNLIEREMKEILKFKTKQYPYNNPDDFHSVTKQPFFKIDPEGKTALPIRGLTPEEVLSTPETKAVLRTNLPEAYFYFLKGRYFELGFQKELDRLFGQTGITILDVFDYVEKASYEDFDRISELAGWTPEQLSYAQKNLAEGIKRLREEYQFNADTLPYLNSETGYSARIGLAAIRFKFAAGYGVSGFGETLIELAKQAPELYTVPLNVIKALRYALADYRFSKRKLLESDIGDLSFVLENFRTDFANRFMGEIGYGAFRSDSRLSTKVANSVLNIRNAQGILETSTRTFEEAGKWMQSIGSLQSITNGTRALAKQRIQRLIWKYMKKGSIDKLFDALQESLTADELAALKKAAASDSKAEATLWKKFAGIARHEAKFGDPNEAALFLKYGLSTKEQIAHLRWAMEKAGHRNGRINIFNISDIYEDLRDNPVDGFDPEVLASAISAYAHMVEDLIIKTATSELKGLNKVTSLDSRSTFGRMFYALTSWVRAYQDNVILDFGSRSTVKYIASGIFLYAAIDTIIGLFKEWLAGRETEDIMQEFEDQPSQFVLRGVSRIPFLGIANGLVEAGASAISGMTGGSYQYYGVPLLPAGAGASMSAVQGIYNNISDITSDAVMKQEVNLKALSGLFGAETLINRSPLAIPARMLETNNAFQEADAIQKYLELVHRNPYPYMDKAASRVKPVGIENVVTPRNLDLERQQYLKDLEKRQKQQSLIRPPAIGFNDQKGVSGILGDILGQSE